MENALENRLNLEYEASVLKKQTLTRIIAPPDGTPNYDSILHEANKTLYFLYRSSTDENVAAPNIDIITKHGFDAIKVGWDLLTQNENLEIELLSLRKRVMVDYYRIYLTIKHSIEFTSYANGLSNNQRIIWKQFYDIIQINRFSRELNKYSELSDEIHSLRRDQLDIIRKSFVRNNVPNNWLEMLNLIENDFDVIERRRNYLKNKRYI